MTFIYYLIYYNHYDLVSTTTPISPSLAPNAIYLHAGDKLIVDTPAIVSTFDVNLISYLK